MNNAAYKYGIHEIQVWQFQHMSIVYTKPIEGMFWVEEWRLLKVVHMGAEGGITLTQQVCTKLSATAGTMAAATVLTILFDPYLQPFC
jgi:hypothetical protein